MRDLIVKPFTIFALNAENQLEELAAVSSLVGSGFKILGGAYKHKKETSYLVPLESLDSDKLRLIEHLAAHFNQESILLRDQFGVCSLRFLQGIMPKNRSRGYNDQDLGYWTQISKAEALESGNYSYDPNTDLYYAAKNTVVVL